MKHRLRLKKNTSYGSPQDESPTFVYSFRVFGGRTKILCDTIRCFDRSSFLSLAELSKRNTTCMTCLAGESSFFITAKPMQHPSPHNPTCQFILTHELLVLLYQRTKRNVSINRSLIVNVITIVRRMQASRIRPFSSMISTHAYVGTSSRYIASSGQLKSVTASPGVHTKIKVR